MPMEASNASNPIYRKSAQIWLFPMFQPKRCIRAVTFGLVTDQTITGGLTTYEEVKSVGLMTQSQYGDNIYPGSIIRVWGMR